MFKKLVTLSSNLSGMAEKNVLDREIDGKFSKTKFSKCKRNTNRNDIIKLCAFSLYRKEEIQEDNRY